MSSFEQDVITAETAVTLDGLFRERVRRSPDRIAYRSYDKTTKKWLDSTWRSLAHAVAVWQKTLAQESLSRGDRVAILVKNCKEWVIFEQAAMGLGLLVIPLYVDDRPENIAYILNDAEVKLLLVGNPNHWRRLSPVVGPSQSLRRVVILDGDASESERKKDPRVVWAKQWLISGNASLDLQSSQAQTTDLATIVYTSGTTGKPKGVMLSHQNILTTAEGSLAVCKVYADDVFLSFLPLSHTYERTVGYFLPMMAGATVAYARSVQQLSEDFKVINPSAIIAVPKIFETIYSRVQLQLAKAPGWSRWVFQNAVAVGWTRFRWKQGLAGFNPVILLWPLADRLVARKVRARFGTRIRTVVSGGAALPVAVSKTFLGLGLNILQGYGLTETSPVVSGNPAHCNDPSSVGVTLPKVEIRIGENDELLVRGPGVMLGYWNNPSATAEILDKEGWLHTGDQAKVEREHLYITGRIKDILVLSNGEKLPPVDMEASIELDPLFDQSMVLGEGKAYLSALVVLNPEMWLSVARGLGLDPSNANSVNHEKCHKELLSRMRQQLSSFPGYAKVRRVYATLEPWTVENNLLTPSLKVRRMQVMQYFKNEIASMYDGL